MNQIYRALHMPPKRLIKKLSGQKEIYTIAVRRAPKGEGFKTSEYLSCAFIVALFLTRPSSDARFPRHLVCRPPAI